MGAHLLLPAAWSLLGTSSVLSGHHLSYLCRPLHTYLYPPLLSGNAILPHLLTHCYTTPWVHSTILTTSGRNSSPGLTSASHSHASPALPSPWEFLPLHLLPLWTLLGLRFPRLSCMRFPPAGHHSISIFHHLPARLQIHRHHLLISLKMLPAAYTNKFHIYNIYRWVQDYLWGILTLLVIYLIYNLHLLHWVSYTLSACHCTCTRLHPACLFHACCLHACALPWQMPLTCLPFLLRMRACLVSAAWVFCLTSAMLRFSFHCQHLCWVPLGWILPPTPCLSCLHCGLPLLPALHLCRSGSSCLLLLEVNACILSHACLRSVCALCQVSAWVMECTSRGGVLSGPAPGWATITRLLGIHCCHHTSESSPPAPLPFLTTHGFSFLPLSPAAFCTAPATPAAMPPLPAVPAGSAGECSRTACACTGPALFY